MICLLIESIAIHSDGSSTANSCEQGSNKPPGASPVEINATWAWHYSLSAIEALRNLRECVPEELTHKVREACETAGNCLDWATLQMPQFRAANDSYQDLENHEEPGSID